MSRKSKTFRWWTAFSLWTQIRRRWLVCGWLRRVSATPEPALRGSSPSIWRHILMVGRSYPGTCRGRLFTCSTPMNDWQRCDVVNSNNVSDDESREIAAFWKEEVRQYQVPISYRGFRRDEALRSEEEPSK
ncbi:retrotransposon hot spot (RHS) protein [Trypanosoma cruzi]|nr:retrotransposon hot spot (RHS) protein [Trypanosoma cruzi]